MLSAGQPQDDELLYISGTNVVQIAQNACMLMPTISPSSLEATVRIRAKQIRILSYIYRI